jgi:Domain of unknown function (DUF4167)
MDSRRRPQNGSARCRHKTFEILDLIYQDGSVFMNNRQTNRRRGRGNNNRTQSNNRNGYDHQNRVDNRARGNASQMLEKYKKLAQDAQHNGDRVNAEYYLQFADHYFRVLADYRSRQEEGRPQREWRNDEREAGEDWRDDDREPQDDSDDAVVTAEADGDDDYRRPQRQDREDRSARAERNDRGDRAERSDRPERNDRQDRGERNDRGNRNDRNGRNNNNRRDRNEPTAGPGREEQVFEERGLDAAVLPPAIGIANDDEETAVAPAPRKPRARKPKAVDTETVAAAE